MAAEACPVCDAPVPLDQPGTIVTCSACQSPFVPHGRGKLPLMVRGESAPVDSLEGIELSDDFRGQFHIGRLLGVGAIGMVCSAIHRDSKRTVAVKFLKRMNNPALTGRFTQEGRLLAKVQHPSVLKVFDFGEVGGHPYLVTELVAGGTLRQKLAHGRLTPEHAMRLAIGCLDGLAACHEAGFVHRDLKPENILVTAEGLPVIADLGIARTLSVVSGLTAPGAVMGTPRYMAPEQARGDKAGIGTDIYAMGTILYEMLTGKPPFNDQDVTVVMLMQIKQEPVPIKVHCADLPEGLAELVHLALSKRIADRPASAPVFAKALVRLVEPFGPVSRMPAIVEDSSGHIQLPKPGSLALKAPSTPVPAQVTPQLPRRSTGRPRQIPPEPAAIPTAPPLPAARPSSGIGLAMVACCLVIAPLALLVPREPRPHPVPTPAPTSSTVAPTPAPPDLTALAPRLDSLRTRRLALAVRVAALRAELENDRLSAHLEEVRAAALEAERNVRDSREVVGLLGETPGAELTRALATQYLAMARQRWLHQKVYMITRKPDSASDMVFRSVLGSGPEVAREDMVPALRRWLSAVEHQLHRPASMPSTAGPELAELLTDVHDVATATYILDWEESAMPLVDRAGKSFFADLERLQGIVGHQIQRICEDLWRWGQADGTLMSAASGALFGDSRASTITQLRSLASFFSGEARTALVALAERAQGGFRAPSDVMPSKPD